MKRTGTISRAIGPMRSLSSVINPKRRAPIPIHRNVRASRLVNLNLSASGLALSISSSGNIFFPAEQQRKEARCRGRADLAARSDIPLYTRRSIIGKRTTRNNCLPRFFDFTATSTAYLFPFFPHYTRPKSNEFEFYIRNSGEGVRLFA